MENTESLTKNPGFLQAVICMIAEEVFDQEIIDTNSEHEIGPGEQWDSKEDWMNDKISGWFTDAAKKIKIFPDGKDISVKKMSIDFARSIYNLSLGEKLDLNDGTDTFVLRVPGGWIYVIDVVSSEQKTVFVPFNDEFKKLAELDYSETLKI